MLHLASRNGKLKFVKHLLRNGADINQRNAFGKTALHVAAEMGFTDIVRTLLDHQVKVNAIDGKRNTALHLAARNGYMNVVKLLLRKGANVKRSNAYGKTSVHIAAEIGYADIVSTLLDHKGKVHAIDRKGDTALHLAAGNGHIAVVNILLNQSTDVHEQTSSQVDETQIPAVAFELSQNSITKRVGVGRPSHLLPTDDDNVQINDTSRSHSSIVIGQAKPLHLGDELVRENLSRNISVNACNKEKMTPLHLACQNGHTSVVEILLNNHLIVDVAVQSGETPFFLAVKNGHADVTKLLLSRGFSSFQKFSLFNETPLHVAIDQNHINVVEVILKHFHNRHVKLTPNGKALEKNVELLTRDGRRVPAKIFWTKRFKSLQLNKYVLSHSDRLYPQIISTPSIEPKIVQLLLSVDHCIYSETNIVDCFRSIVTAIPKFLMQEPETKTQNIREVAQLLIKSRKFHVNHQDYRLNTFLHDLLRKKNEFSSYDCIIRRPCRLSLLWRNQIINYLTQLLLEKGADYNLKNSFGETPLMFASEKGLCDVIQILFDWEKKSGMRLDLDARDQHGATALIKAAESHQVSAVRLLINHGASLNLYDYNGFTALHSALYDHNLIWFDLHFFCDGLLQQRCKKEECLQIDNWHERIWKWQRARKWPAGTFSTKKRLKIIFDHNKEVIRIREEIVKLLLADDETKVNAIDFRGNTPLDLEVKSSKRVTTETVDALRSRCAISNLGLLQLEDQTPIDVARADQRGRNPLHRLVISIAFDHCFQPYQFPKWQGDMLDIMANGIRMRPKNYKHSAVATDDKGRTPLHYAVMSLMGGSELLELILELGSNVNAVDMYGKTPLHYIEDNSYYQLLVKHKADEDKKDKDGFIPRDLMKLREMVLINDKNTRTSTIGEQALYMPIDIARRFDIGPVEELTRRKVVETIRIHSQSPLNQKSSEETVWKLWADGKFDHLNGRLAQLEPFINQFIERLANGIKKRDERFECQPILVGSANEETKIVISGDFDFNLKLTKFSQLCDAVPHSLGPKGYFQLKWKSNIPEGDMNPGFEKFDNFFNTDQCLLTNEVNSRFQIILEDVLRDHKFWQDEHHFEMPYTNEYEKKSDSPAGLCKTLLLRMIRPIEDGEGGFLFIKITVDIAACVHVKICCFDDPLEIGLSPLLNTGPFIFVFDQPRIDPSKPVGSSIPFSETFAKISFAPHESRIIKESPPLLKAAYVTCKRMTYCRRGITYQLKTCLLFCMEAFNDMNGSDTKHKDKFSSKQLLFWVERIMFCYMEFSRHGIYPCYFMTSFKQPAADLIHDVTQHPDIIQTEVALRYSRAFDYYLDLCPVDTVIDIPIDDQRSRVENPNVNPNPMWEQFDRKEFIRRLSSRDPCS